MMSQFICRIIVTHRIKNLLQRTSESSSRTSASKYILTFFTRPYLYEQQKCILFLSPLAQRSCPLRLSSQYENYTGYTWETIQVTHGKQQNFRYAFQIFNIATKNVENFSYLNIIHDRYGPVTGWGRWCAHAGILGVLSFFASSRPLFYNQGWWSI